MQGYNKMGVNLVWRHFHLCVTIAPHVVDLVKRKKVIMSARIRLVILENVCVMTNSTQCRVFRVSFTWLGSNKGDFIDVIAETTYSACDKALKIKQGKYSSSYKDTDIWKVELLSEAHTT